MEMLLLTMSWIAGQPLSHHVLTQDAMSEEEEEEMDVDE